MKESQRGLLVLLAGAAAAGVYIEVTRPRDVPDKPPAGSAMPSASVAPASTGATPVTRARIDSTLPRLEGAVRAGASDATLPWALAHGLVAFGPAHQASDGRSAVDVIASFADKQRSGTALLIRFPRTKGDSIVEAHDNLFVKTLLEVGVPLERRLVIADGSQVTLERMAADVARRAALPSDDAGWHDVAWTLSALVERKRLGGAAAGGVNLAELTRAALARLERDHALIESFEGDPSQAFDEGSPLRRAKQDKSGIYGHSCGGLHFAQAVLSGVAAEADAELVSRVRRQLGVLLFRYEMEREAYAKLVASRPEHGLLLRVQQLKFFGHLVETLTLARELRLYDASTEGGARIDQVVLLAASDVLDTFDALERGGTFHRLTEIRREREQTYLDLIGDGCHAIRGLRRVFPS